ncbi:MAG TPA: helix-turn-helix domain-containing protein [Candidatus Acidoferrum sp.]|nr:helix-turn-helix domain-containing protein [Candidatus Acidoferrum sp.]
MEKLLTSEQASEILGVSRPTLYKLVNTGRLKAYLVAKAWKFKPSDIEKFLESVRVGE